MKRQPHQNLADMLPANNLVSFVKKMVKNPSESGSASAAAGTKLSRLKQTLTTGLQQATESVTKFTSKKSMGVPSLDLVRGSQSQTEDTSRDADPFWLPLSYSSSLTAHQGEYLTVSLESPGAGIASPQSSAPTPSSSTPVDRSATCRVCVRRLSDNLDVTYLWCSQCNHKVCEDCASYSNIDTKDAVGLAFWRCSVCRRRRQDTPRSPVGVRASHSYSAISNNHLSSLTPTTSGGGTSGGSALPMVVRRQRDRSVGAVSLRNESSSVHDDALDIKKNNTHSFDDLRKLSVSGQRHPNRTRHSQSVRSSHQKLSSTSASESSLDDGEYPTCNSNSARRAAQRRCLASSPFLSAEDAVTQSSQVSRWSHHRRYSSESSDYSDAGPGVQVVATNSTAVPTAVVTQVPTGLTPTHTTNHRRLSFRNKKDYRFYEAEISDGYDADEQSVGTFDSSPSPVSCNDGGAGSINDVVTDEEPATALAAVATASSASVSYRTWAASTTPTTFRSPSEGEVIRIIIDDVDGEHRPKSATLSTPVPAVTVASGGVGASSIHVARLRRDPGRSNQGFLSGFGLTLATSGPSHLHSPHLFFRAVIQSIEAKSSAERAGLRCGDLVLRWDGVQVSGRSFDEIRQELEHSGDSIEIEVERPTPASVAMTAAIDDSPLKEEPSPSRRRQLPQAPFASTPTKPNDTTAIRLQMKFKGTVTEHCHGCLIMVVLGAEIIGPQSLIIDPIATHSLSWVELVLVLPSGVRRKYTTDRAEGSLHTYGLHWNNVLTCFDLSLDEVCHSQLFLSFWTEDPMHRAHLKLAETLVLLEHETLNGQSVWLELNCCDASMSQEWSPSTSPKSPRRHGIDGELTPTSSCSMPRSRSVESDVLLQPEATSWAGGNGLSAPASLVPSRRGSSISVNYDPNRERNHQSSTRDQLSPQSSPSSRRGSSAGLTETAISATNMSRMVQQKLQLEVNKPRRSHSFRLTQPNSPVRVKMIPIQRSASRGTVHHAELGPGQYLPADVNGSDVAGQIKLGVVLTKGNLDVEVIAARHLLIDKQAVPPDTYVQVNLYSAGRPVLHRKTRIVRQNWQPQFQQTLTFDCGAGCTPGDTLIVAVRQKTTASVPSAEKEPSIGWLHLSVDKLPLTFLSLCWYQLMAPPIDPLADS